MGSPSLFAFYWLHYRGIGFNMALDRATYGNDLVGHFDHAVLAFNLNVIVYGIAINIPLWRIKSKTQC